MTDSLSGLQMGKYIAGEAMNVYHHIGLTPTP